MKFIHKNVRKSPHYLTHFIITLLISIACLSKVSIANSNDQCSANINHIEISGNKVTLRENLILWSGLQVGSTLTATTIEMAQQKLMDTGLYKDVRIIVDDLCKTDSSLTIIVHEKRYQLIYPRLSRNGDGDIDKGITYQGSNLFGSDHTLKLTVSHKDYVSGDTAERAIISYDMPLTTKPYQLRWSAHTIDTVLSDTTNQIIESDQGFAFLVGRDWHTDYFSQPIKVFVKFNLQQKSLNQSSSQTDLEPGNFNTMGLRLEYDDIHHEKYRRYGNFYAIEANRGLEYLHTDFEVSYLLLEARKYHRINALDNFNSRYILALASGDIFNEPNYTMGGNDTLRGIEADAFSGNNLWQVNLEYVQGFKNHPSFRLALFSDIGNVFESHTKINDENWQLTYGVGLRWKIHSFVNTDLVIDYARDPKSGFAKIYASTSLFF